MRVTRSCRTRASEDLLLTETEASLRSVDIRMERELAGRVNGGRADRSIYLFLIREVLVHDVECLLIDLQVVMLLKVVDGDHATSLLYVQRVLVDRAEPCSLLIHLSYLQDIVKAIKSNLNYLIIHHREQIAERLDATL